ncbi:MAG: methyltransferase domain-containing protein [Bacteroidetes bacterium]|nr:methyltransferase domain-containing protein [Bacteroidota bacterium]
MQQQAEWFENWFDSPYYHILYKHRDASEAEGFIDYLLQYLEPPASARILDLACGKGRYSRHLASKGYEVVGVDLSPKSIAEAKRLDGERLHFYVHDMRESLPEKNFDYIFNFFTSFGYFDTEEEDLQTLQHVREGLKPGGTFVLDFFNAQYVQQQLTGRERKTVEGVNFDLYKRIEGGKVVKTIHFVDGAKSYYFEERVRLLTLSDFERLFEAAGLQLLHTYGDYRLHAYEAANSPRLILLAKA